MSGDPAGPGVSISVVTGGNPAEGSHPVDASTSVTVSPGATSDAQLGTSLVDVNATIGVGAANVEQPNSNALTVHATEYGSSASGLVDAAVSVDAGSTTLSPGVGANVNVGTVSAGSTDNNSNGNSGTGVNVSANVDAGSSGSNNSGNGSNGASVNVSTNVDARLEQLE